MKSTCPEDQLDIFPAETMASLFGHKPPPAPLPALPFSRRQEIDLDRAAKILDLDATTVLRLRRSGMISGYRIGEGKRRRMRIHYDSVVEYCDFLRREFFLPPRKKASGRPVDSQILPFTPADTILVKEVAHHLDVSTNTVRALLDTGELIGYAILHRPRAEGGTGDWRIFRPHFVEYLKRLQREAKVKAFAPSSVDAHKRSA